MILTWLHHKSIRNDVVYKPHYNLEKTRVTFTIAGTLYQFYISEKDKPNTDDGLIRPDQMQIFYISEEKVKKILNQMTPFKIH